MMVQMHMSINYVQIRIYKRQRMMIRYEDGTNNNAIEYSNIQRTTLQYRKTK